MAVVGGNGVNYGGGGYDPAGYGLALPLLTTGGGGGTAVTASGATGAWKTST